MTTKWKRVHLNMDTDLIRLIDMIAAIRSIRKQDALRLVLIKGFKSSYIARIIKSSGFGGNFLKALDKKK